MHLRVTALARQVGAIGVFDRQSFAVVVPDETSGADLTRAIVNELRNRGFEIHALLRVMPEDA